MVVTEFHGSYKRPQNPRNTQESANRFGLSMRFYSIKSNLSFRVFSGFRGYQRGIHGSTLRVVEFKCYLYGRLEILRTRPRQVHEGTGDNPEQQQQ